MGYFLFGVKILYISLKQQTLIRSLIYKYSLMFCGSSFLVLHDVYYYYYFEVQTCLIIIKSIFFLLSLVVLLSLIRRLYLTKITKIHSCVFFKMFIFIAFTFIFIIHFQLFFVHSLRTSFFCMQIANCPRTIC